MNSENLNNILEKTRMKIAIANLEKESNFMKDKTKFKMVASFILVFILTSGIVFATNYNRIIRYFGLGGGIDKAVENGYIKHPNQDYIGSDTEVNDEETGIVLDNVKVNVKIDDFLMDDLNLSTHINFEFDESIKEVVNIDKLGSMDIKDLIVTDEKNRIIFCINKKAFEEYCSKNNLPYTFGEFNENYMNNGLNSFINGKYAQNNNIILTYNMYADGYPKSKKLNFHFNTIILTQGDKSEKDGKKVFLKGDWNINVDVPEKMYNRQSIAYKVISCSQDNFDIYRANVSDTGFEIGITIHAKDPNTERREELNRSAEERDAGKITEAEYFEMADKIFDEWDMTRPIKMFTDDFDPNAFPYAGLKNGESEGIYVESENVYIFNGENGHKAVTNERKAVTYVENENGKRFECSMSPSRRQNMNWISGENKFDFFETFELTTYDATDKIKVTLLYYGNPVTIELEKGK